MTWQKCRVKSSKISLSVTINKLVVTFEGRAPAMKLEAFKRAKELSSENKNTTYMVETYNYRKRIWDDISYFISGKQLYA